MEVIKRYCCRYIVQVLLVLAVSISGCIDDPALVEFGSEVGSTPGDNDTHHGTDDISSDRPSVDDDGEQPLDALQWCVVHRPNPDIDEERLTRIVAIPESQSLMVLHQQGTNFFLREWIRGELGLRELPGNQLPATGSDFNSLACSLDGALCWAGGAGRVFVYFRADGRWMPAQFERHDDSGGAGVHTMEILDVAYLDHGDASAALVLVKRGTKVELYRAPVSEPIQFSFIRFPPVAEAALSEPEQLRCYEDGVCLVRGQRWVGEVDVDTQRIEPIMVPLDCTAQTAVGGMQCEYMSMHFSKLTRDVWVLSNLGDVYRNRRARFGEYTQTGPQRLVRVPMFDIAMTSANDGWIVGQKRAIFRTTDGGDSWSNYRTDDMGLGEASLKSVAFLNERAVWAISDSGHLLMYGYEQCPSN